MIVQRASRERATRHPSRVFIGRRRGAWAVTLLATAASWYVLETFAIAVGGAVAASGLLDGLDRAALLAFLAATYVAWGAGLRRNLAANWSLLTRTGTSTNAISKASHDIAHSLTAGPRACRIATSAGYVLTEVAKEVPYYASASGVALLSDAVSADDALVFLAGTNIGAAIYEYAVAWATRTYLRLHPAADEAVPHDALGVAAAPVVSAAESVDIPAADGARVARAAVAGNAGGARRPGAGSGRR